MTKSSAAKDVANPRFQDVDDFGVMNFVLEQENINTNAKQKDM